MASALAATHASGAILDVNPKACATYGYSRDELCRISLADLSSGEPPCTAEQGMAYIEQAKQGARPVFEWHRRNKDGSLHWDEVRLKAAQIDGKPLEQSQVLLRPRFVGGTSIGLAPAA